MKNNYFYTVQSNDTLSGISRRTGVPVSELAKLNGIRNPNRIKAGEKLALNKEAVCGVNLQFLDRDHNPLRDLSYVVRYCGREVSGKTDHTGRSEPIMTEWPTDKIRILVRRTGGDLKEIATVASGYANKLVTLVSPKLKLEAKTHPHPKEPGAEAPANTVPTGKGPPSKHTPPAEPATGVPQSWWTEEMGFLGIKVSETKTAANKPVAKVANDGVEEPDIIAKARTTYTGAQITEENWLSAANELGCEIEVIMAIAEQETEKLKALGMGAFDKQRRPTILFERHKFGKNTNQKFSEDNPDISGSKEYMPGSARDERGKRYDDGNHYGLFSWQYKKLAKAYTLDPGAALAACSWGKFQIMGENYRACGFNDVKTFVESMCISEVEHLKAVVNFATSTGLRPALKGKNWASIAAAYNGPRYKRNSYDTQLKNIYDKLLKRKK